MSAPTTIQFPSAFDDEDTFFGFPVDSLVLTLASSITDVDTTCTVNEDTSDVPIPYLARFASGEFVWVTAKDDGSKTLTISRGENGSSAVSHTAGADDDLYFGLSAPQYSQLIRGIENLQETLGLDVDTTGSAAGTVAGRISDVEASASRLLAAPGSDLTISSGAVTVGDDGMYTVLGEGSAADVLTTISGGTAGDVVVLRAGAQVITIDSGAGNIVLSGGVDKALSDEDVSSIVLVYDGTNWVEIASNVQMVLIGLYVDGGGAAVTTAASPAEWPWAPPFYLMGIYSSTDGSGDGEADILYGNVGAAPATVLTAWDHSSEQFKSDTTLSGITRQFGSKSWRLAITGDFDTATWLSVALWGWRR